MGQQSCSGQAGSCSSHTAPAACSGPLTRVGLWAQDLKEMPGEIKEPTTSFRGDTAEPHETLWYGTAPSQA